MAKPVVFVSVKLQDGMTALMYAALNNRLDVVTALLDNAAGTEARNKV